MSLPNGQFLRYGEVMSWLETEYNIPRNETRKLIETDTIKGAPLRPGGRDFYKKAQIMAVLNGETQTTKAASTKRK